MPELPEVEIARRNLSRWLRGKTIERVVAPRSRIFRPDGPTALVRALPGRRVRAVERRGKWLRMRLDDGIAVYAHLGMSGRWVARKTEDPPDAHERLRIELGPRTVRYVDPRMFGRVLLRQAGETLLAYQELGPDPLDDGLDPEVLASSMKLVRRSIKETMLDQRLFAGVGNIQATEALWRAKLDPRRAASSLSTKELRALLRALRRSIDATLAREEGPEITYVDDAGAPNPFDVYGRSGEPCPRCRTPLQRIVQGGRSTVHCPRCQSR